MPSAGASYVAPGLTSRRASICYRKIDGGRWREAKFLGLFSLVHQSEIDDILAKIADGEEQDEDLASRLLVGWSEIVGEDGQPLPYSEEAKASILDLPHVRRAVLKAYGDSLGGRAARRKN